MNSLDQQVNTAAIRKLEEENNSSIIPSKKVHFCGSFRQQDWPLPDSLIYYIRKYPPSPTFYEKLVKSCKYFYAKNPLFVLECLFNGYERDEWHTLFTEQALDMKNLPCKLWITKSLDIRKALPFENMYQNYISILRPKLYRCDAKYLYLNLQTILYNDFCLLIGCVEEMDLAYSVVTYEDGSVVSFEKLVEACPKLKRINFYNDRIFPSVSKDTVNNLRILKLLSICKIPHFKALKHLQMTTFGDEFDLDAFYSYIKGNKTTQIKLIFDESISDAYKIRIDEIIDEIIAAEIHDYKIPHIQFFGINEYKFGKLLHLVYG